jgi:predicted transcriptional regulator
MVLKLEYGVKKDLLIRYLEEIKTLSEDLSKDINDDVDYEIQKLAQNQFNIAVVGQFKIGTAVQREYQPSHKRIYRKYKELHYRRDIKSN